MCPKELWRVEISGMWEPYQLWVYSVVKFLVFRRWGSSVVCVPTWVMVKGLCSVLPSCSVKKGKLTSQRRKNSVSLMTDFGRDCSHGLKKKDVKHSFGGSWGPRCLPLGSILSATSPIWKNPSPLKWRQIMHWWRRCLKIIHLFLERYNDEVNNGRVSGDGKGERNLRSLGKDEFQAFK